MKHLSTLVRQIMCTVQWRIQHCPGGCYANAMGMRQHIIWQFFVENCMKIMEVGPKGSTPLRSTTAMAPLQIAIVDGTFKLDIYVPFPIRFLNMLSAYS